MVFFRPVLPARDMTRKPKVDPNLRSSHNQTDENKAYRIQSFHFDLTQDLKDTLVAPKVPLPLALQRTLFDAFATSEIPVTIDGHFKAGLARRIP